MKVIDTCQEWLSIRQEISNTQTLGFVPTMGCLHEGHGTLLRRSIKENDLTVLSVFVNPTQFNQKSDYDLYPRTEADIEYARELGVDYLFKPTPDEMYPHGYDFISLVTNAPLSQIMEGRSRPGHFNGMLTIVLKLLLLMCPTRAYFGEKDHQQLALVKRLVENYFLQCEIVGCPTVREASGLALSSRNKRLSKDGYAKAQKMAQLFQQVGQQPEEALLRSFRELGVEIEYLQKFNERAYLAAWIDGVRLIDNISLHS